MRIIIPSRGRHDYAPTVEHMPEILKSQVEVWVPKDEYKAYKTSPIFKGVKITTWPSYIDCIPKKRRYLYEKIDGSYMVADDDIKLMVWDKEKANYAAATTNPKKFMRGLELAYEEFESNAIVGIANTFMMSMRVKEKRTFEFADVAFGLVGFSADRPKIDFKTFFFTDTAMPMQILAKGKTAHMSARVAYNLRANKKLAATGTTPYRSDEVVKYSAISLAQQMLGHVTGMKNTGHLGGGWSLKKSFHKPNIEKANAFLREFAEENGLTALPPLVDLDLRTPMEELFATYSKNFALAAKGKGNKLPKLK